MTSTNNTDVLRQLFVAAINTSDKPGLVRLLTSRVSLGHLAAVLEYDAEDYEVDAFEDERNLVTWVWLNTLRDNWDAPFSTRRCERLQSLASSQARCSCHRHAVVSALRSGLESFGVDAVYACLRDAKFFRAEQLCKTPSDVSSPG